MRIKALVNTVGAICIYTNSKTLPISMLSVEHIIPRSFAKYNNLNSKILNDPINLHVATRYINCVRQNYTFANWDSDTWKTDSKNKLFYPALISQGAIARTVIKMTEKYPELRENMHMVIDTDTLLFWNEHHASEYEEMRYKLLRKIRS